MDGEGAQYYSQLIACSYRWNQSNLPKLQVFFSVFLSVISLLGPNIVVV